MKKEYLRTLMMIGEDNLNKLKNSKVAVFGIGGVGGYVVEALTRAGISNITIIDNDTVSLSNINRQIIALHSTVDKLKVDVMEERIKDINPLANVKKYNMFVLPDNIDSINFDFDYVVDALDTMTAKLSIIKKCKAKDIKIISCMGTGNRIDPTLFRIEDISKTKICPVCKAMRKLLKQENISNLKVLYSIENPIKPLDIEKDDNKRSIPSSISFVPSVAGLIIASEVIKELISFYGNGINNS